MYSTLKPTIRFTRNTRCPCSNDNDDHGIFFLRHKAGPPDEPRVDGRWCDVQHQEHMTVQSSCTQKQHVDKTLVLFCDKLIEPKNSKNSTENAHVLIVYQIDVLSHLYTVSKSLTSASAINVFHPAGREKVSATDAHDVTKSV